MNNQIPVNTVNSVDDLARQSVEEMLEYIAVRYEPTDEEMTEMYQSMCNVSLEEKETSNG